MTRTIHLLTGLFIVFILAIGAGCNVIDSDTDNDNDDIELETEPVFTAALDGQVLEGTDATVDASDGLVMALLWSVYDPGEPYVPVKAGTIDGQSFPSPFKVRVEDAPPEHARYQIESADPDVGVVTDPDAPFVARASLYIVTEEAINDTAFGAERISAFDTDAVVGMVPDISLFYTPVALDSGGGVRGLYPADGVTIPEGYSLWRWGWDTPDERIALATPLEALLGYVAD